MYDTLHISYLAESKNHKNSPWHQLKEKSHWWIEYRPTSACKRQNLGLQGLKIRHTWRNTASNEFTKQKIMRADLHWYWYNDNLPDFKSRTNRHRIVFLVYSLRAALVVLHKDSTHLVDLMWLQIIRFKIACGTRKCQAGLNFIVYFLNSFL